MPQSKLAVDSREARRQFQQCQQCCKSKDEVKHLFTCAACKVTLYCSNTCQKAHWPAHKAMCKIHRERIVEMAKLDGEVLSRAPDNTFLPSEFIEELRAFTSKFNPALFQAGFNAIRIPEYPTSWTQVVFYLMLERLLDVAPDSRPWSRFRITSARPIPVVGLYMLWGKENTRKFAEQKALQEKRHKEAGNLGTITIVLSSRCAAVDPPLVVHNTTFVAFGDHSQGELEISDDWGNKLNETVEKLSGRQLVTTSSKAVKSTAFA
ncbi:hypothetical protein B0H21DRAFT_894658 [Amylocystis lapponica]|nr:hypothetical protein B0H21DRAFT_894658 [Amylocystis lapponica]